MVFDLKNGTPAIESGDHKFTGKRCIKERSGDVSEKKDEFKEIRLRPFAIPN